MNDKLSIPEYLIKHGVRKTSFRIELLEIFRNNRRGLSHRDIKSQVKSSTDKVTIYRALDTFLDKGIIHKVPDANNVSRYALTKTSCNHKDHNHAHFICKKCEGTFCLNEFELPIYNDTKGFNIKNTNLILEGVCPDCSPIIN
ncbi:transcriptional repressor [Flammeovirga pectinis]|uniref:Transcriptional repressor n=1 Tax=Flammeovirga pectinis TaxID=2494373 RepID=A0A3Q9FMP4_9BACT|nr:transcriptional repressor [Flammeovirga pectinis]AZQ63298.1 transcriptional repressor [Flammeovirga pectinis]